MNASIVGRVGAVFGALLLACPVAFAAGDVAAGSCGEIRGQVAVVAPPAPELLRQMALRKDCGFTAEEFYRVAYGGVMPRTETRRHRWLAEERDDDGEDDR